MNKEHINWEVIFHPSSVRAEKSMKAKMISFWRTVVIIAGVVLLFFGLCGVL